MHGTNNPVLMSSKFPPACREQQRSISGFTGGMTEAEMGEVPRAGPDESSLPMLSSAAFISQNSINSLHACLRKVSKTIRI